MIKDILIDIKKTVYVLFAVCFLSITGAIIIHINPDGYFKIHTFPLFQWLLDHKRIDTFWIYFIITLFAYIGLATIFCFANDFKRRNFLIAIMHFSVIIFLISHVVSAIYTFRSNDHLLIENNNTRVFIKEHNKAIFLNVKKISYELTQLGIPVNIKGIIELPNKAIEEISINNPIKVDDYHIILKDLTGFLSEIELSIERSENIQKLSLKPNTPVKLDNFYLTILDITEDFSVIKLKIDDGKNTLINFVRIGEYLNISNQKYLIKNIKPNFQTALVIDIVYDPSIIITFLASSLFTFALVAQLMIKISKILESFNS